MWFQDMDHSDEVITDVCLNGVPVPVPLFLDMEWEWPAEGTLTCQFIHFPAVKPIAQVHYDALLEEVRV